MELVLLAGDEAVTIGWRKTFNGAYMVDIWRFDDYDSYVNTVIVKSKGVKLLWTLLVDNFLYV